MQLHLFKQPPVGKTRVKYYLMLFMHRNAVELLTSFAKINKHGAWGLNKVRGGVKKNLKTNTRPPSCIKLPRVGYRIYKILV